MKITPYESESVLAAATPGQPEESLLALFDAAHVGEQVRKSGMTAAWELKVLKGLIHESEDDATRLRALKYYRDMMRDVLRMSGLYAVTDTRRTASATDADGNTIAVESVDRTMKLAGRTSRDTETLLMEASKNVGAGGRLINNTIVQETLPATEDTATLEDLLNDDATQNEDDEDEDDFFDDDETDPAERTNSRDAGDAGAIARGFDTVQEQRPCDEAEAGEDPGRGPAADPEGPTGADRHADPR